MKGLVFTEFMELVESAWSFETADAIIARANVSGAYTSVGNYPHDEMVALVVALSEETGMPVADLIRAFGKHLFGRFVLAYPQFFDGIQDSFQFLGGIETVIHAEVRKLYPDADLPTFEAESSADKLTLTYYSDHPFADLAQGLIEGCLAHFGEAIDLDRLPPSANSKAHARFLLTRRNSND